MFRSEQTDDLTDDRTTDYPGQWHSRCPQCRKTAAAGNGGYGLSRRSMMKAAGAAGAASLVPFATAG